jgi:hypothetical protein
LSIDTIDFGLRAKSIAFGSNLHASLTVCSISRPAPFFGIPKPAYSIADCRQAFFAFKPHRSSHLLAVSSISSDAVLSSAIAAVLMALF